MTESNERDPIGTVADEARKLFDTIQGRATRHVGRTVFNSFTGGGGGGERSGAKDVWGEAVSEPHDEYICRACPVCRAIAAQRESGIDVAGHLAAAGGELFAAFRQTIDVLSRPAPRRTGGEGERDGEREQEHEHDGSRDNRDKRDNNVEHIDLG